MTNALNLNFLAPKRTAVAWCGINDIVGGTSFSNLTNYMRVWIDAVRAFDPSCKIAGVTILKIVGLSGAGETMRGNVNTVIKSGWFDYYVDLDLVANLADPSNMTYFQADGVHTTIAGNVEVRTAVEAVLVANNRLTGPSTYYIDFGAANDSANGTTTSTPWKRCPGMTGFAGSYSHSAGDSFIFKGGVSWTSGVFPITIANSGSFGNIDKYTTDHTYFSGGAWSQPIWNNQGSGNKSSGAGIVLSSKDFVQLNDLNIINQGVAGQSDGYGMALTDVHNFYFTSNTFAPQAKVGITASWANGTHTNVNFNYNIVSNVSSFIWIAGEHTVPGGTCLIRWVNIIGNTLTDGHEQIVDGAHADGLVHFFATTNGVAYNFDPSTVFTNVVIAGNTVGGDWSNGYGGDSSGGLSAMVFCEATCSAQIYNNVFSFSTLGGSSPVSNGDACFGMRSYNYSRVEIYNNTCVQNSTHLLQTGIACGNGDANSTTIVKNNLVSGYNTAFEIIGTNGAVTCDYNLWDCASGNLFADGFVSYATWVALGFDAHGILGTAPSVISWPSNLALQNGAGVDAATSLSAIFATDRNGTSRPQGGAWDMGAYETSVDLPFTRGPIRLRSPLRMTR